MKSLHTFTLVFFCDICEEINDGSWEKIPHEIDFTQQDINLIVTSSNGNGSASLWVLNSKAILFRYIKGDATGQQLISKMGITLFIFLSLIILKVKI